MHSELGSSDSICLSYSIVIDTLEDMCQKYQKQIAGILLRLEALEQVQGGTTVTINPLSWISHYYSGSRLTSPCCGPNGEVA